MTDGSFTFAAKIDVGPGQRACSGALVDPWWVLTAKSCFSVDGQPVIAGRPARPTTVTVGRPDLTKNTGVVSPVIRIVPHPDRDAVLVRLSQRVDVAPVPLGAAPTADEQLTVAGFGRTATTWVPDQLHTGAFAVQAVAAGTFDLLGTGTGAICRGDLGGPTVRLVAGKPQLVGLHHAAWQGGCLAETETRRSAVETRVDDLGPWLTANMPQGPATDQYQDINFLYVYATGDVAPQTFPATSTGGFTSPLGEWKGGGGAYAADRVKVFNDDFDGDGIDDVAVMSTSTTNTFAVDTFITRPDGKHGAPVRSWTASNFGNLTSMKMTSGDFNGDGRADLSAFYGYGNGDEAWINWLARPDGGFDAPIEAWRASNFGTWSSTSVFAGDVNGDGRDDATLFYAYASGAMALITWPGQADGKFGTGYTSWYTPAEKPFGSLSSMKLADGDFNGDGRGDVAVLYGYGSGKLALFTWTAKEDGTFNSPLESWSSTTFGQFASIKMVSGDYTGDKRDDLAFLYKYSDDGLGLHTFAATPAGGFNAPFGSWRVGRGVYGWWPSMKMDGE
ncbi:Repeat domain-containing protein [Micromonospora chersina]|uniref:Repeat domain-containing protein n=1 Tax=Micromonospora chersina TaxID=47854 RepID=A0A1C6U0Q5_9ACTN|nr:Repeat domain-containing protein [Micromonospora chersina]